MNSRVFELLDVIRQSETELQEIRQKCTHLSFFVGMWSWRIGSYHPSRICNECHIAIAGITEEESKTVLNDFNKTKNDSPPFYKSR